MTDKTCGGVFESKMFFGEPPLSNLRPEGSRRRDFRRAFLLSA